ncbi:MAG: hypothetical protein ACK4M7_04280 [Burkholderiales bacterium]
MQGCSLLRHRDIQILQFVAKFGYCQVPQIASFCRLTEANTIRIIKRLEEANYLVKKKIIANEAMYVFLTKKSATLLAIKLSSQVTLHTLYHDTLLIDLYFMLQLQYPDACIKSDKELRRELEVADKLRIPDLLINDHLAIELELSEKPTARLVAIINSYIVNNQITQVHYYLTAKGLAQKIYTLTNLNSKFKFFLFEQNLDRTLHVQAFVPQLTTHDELALELKNSGGKTFGGFTF